MTHRGSILEPQLLRFGSQQKNAKLDQIATASIKYLNKIKEIFPGADGELILDPVNIF